MLNFMPTYRLQFHLKRKITCYVDAESESDIDDFLEENESFNPVEDEPGMVDEDDSGWDDDEDRPGDYSIVEEESITANYIITPGLELLEKDNY